MASRPYLSWGFNDEDDSDPEGAWDMLTEDLSELLDKINPDGYWNATVENFGWRNQSGHKFFRADNSEEFLQKLLPRTDNHFKIFKRGNVLRIQNYHHDSPTGNEWYTVKKATQKEIENEDFS